MGQNSAPAVGQVVGVAGHGDQAARGKGIGHGRVGTSNAGKGDAVDSCHIVGAEVVGVRVVVGGDDTRTGVVGPRGVGPSAVA